MKRRAVKKDVGIVKKSKKAGSSVEELLPEVMKEPVSESDSAEEEKKPFRRKKSPVKQYLVSGEKEGHEKILAFFLARNQPKAVEAFKEKFKGYSVTNAFETAESDMSVEELEKTDPFQWRMGPDGEVLH